MRPRDQRGRISCQSTERSPVWPVAKPENTHARARASSGQRVPNSYRAKGMTMAELTVLDEKLAEVLGLAQAAQQAAKKVATLARKEKETELVELMGQMGD